MGIAYLCKCGKSGQAPDRFAGEVMSCPACKGPVPLPPPAPSARVRSAGPMIATALACLAIGSLAGFAAAEFFEPPSLPAPKEVIAEPTPEEITAARLRTSRGLGVNRDTMVGELEDVYRFQNIREDDSSMMFQIGNGVTVVMRGPEDDVSSVLIIGSRDDAHFTDMARAMMAVSKQVWHDRQWLAAWLAGAFDKADARYSVHTVRAGVVVSLATGVIDESDIVIMELHKAETAPPTPDELRI